MMDRAKLAKTVSLYERGLVSASEFADSLLLRLLDEPEVDGSFLSSLGWLPDEVRQKFQDRLGKIQEADYHWIPLLITSIPDRSEPPDYPEKLRKICAVIETTAGLPLNRP